LLTTDEHREAPAREIALGSQLEAMLAQPIVRLPESISVDAAGGRDSLDIHC